MPGDWELTRQPSRNEHNPSLLPQIPPHTAMSLSLPAPNGTSSVTGVSTQSMRTSSFAMSDADDVSEKLSPFDSLRIRRTYSRPRRARTSVPEDNFSENHSFNNESEDNEFLNTDRFHSSLSLYSTLEISLPTVLEKDRG